ncbi:MAG: hypothetical protein MZV70_54275 [Desulfobacterales bacterium]|nr:hypothetical protein [Desulfobacterales bacterium]
MNSVTRTARRITNTTTSTVPAPTGVGRRAGRQRRLGGLVLVHQRYRVRPGSHPVPRGKHWSMVVHRSRRNGHSGQRVRPIRGVPVRLSRCHVRRCRRVQLLHDPGYSYRGPRRPDWVLGAREHGLGVGG